MTAHTIYINGSAKAEEMYLPRLSERLKFLKEDEEA